MAIDFSAAFPRQNLPAKSKGTKWGKQCVDWCASRTYFNYAPVRRTKVGMKINYDLINGIIHMEDVARIINPGDISTSFIPDKIQHYPIINSKLNTLRGEESARVFNWHAIVTNPYSISQMEEEKKKAFDTSVRQIVENPDISDEQATQQLRDTKEYYDLDYQDQREIAANELIRHYSKEQDFKQTFTDGFLDACICSIEVYQCGIRGGEPFLERLNPLKLSTFRSGYSNRIEDADIIVYEDYWSPGRIFEVFYDELSAADIKKLTEDLPYVGGDAPLGAAGNVNEAYEFVGESGVDVSGDSLANGLFDELHDMVGGIGTDLLPYDVAGNVRVIQVWWKSLRKIYKVKSFDPETGDEVFDFYPETYIPDESAGEVATPLWINEMWQGTLIGEDVYVGIRPCLVQHNSISNPSKCHSGIVGTIYNINEAKPMSLVDMMKPYNYLYDAVHAKLVDLIATNWGKLVKLDLALKPDNWEVDKWVYFARTNKALIVNSFNEGHKGAATGKLAVGVNANVGVVDADWGQSIQNYINILQWVQDAMSDIVGINRQREGQTYSRETVGGIERAVLQSSYITDWLFQQHEVTKGRVLNCFLDYCKAAVRGRSKKFQYTMSDGARRILEIDGDTFAESDYGIVMDNSADTQKLDANLTQIGQAALQNQYKLSAILRLYSTASLQEKMRIIEKAEKDLNEQQQQQAQQQQQQLAQQIQAQQAQAQAKIDNDTALARLEADTKIRVAEINSQAEFLRFGAYNDGTDKEIEKDKLDIEREKLHNDILALDKEFNFKEKELAQQKQIERDKIAAQKEIAKSRQTSTKPVTKK